MGIGLFLGSVGGFIQVSYEHRKNEFQSIKGFLPVVTTMTFCMLVLLSVLLAVNNVFTIRIEAGTQSVKNALKPKETLALVKRKVIEGLFSSCEAVDHDFVLFIKSNESDLEFPSCDDRRGYSLSQFAVEQAKALIHAVELINESKALGNATLVIHIWDGCEAQRKTIVSMLMSSNTPTAIAIVRPYYTVFNSSKWVRKLIKLHSNLKSNRMPSALTQFRLDPMLAVVLGHSFEFIGVVDVTTNNRLIKLQQVCETQAKVVFSLLKRDGRCDLIFVVGNVHCGLWAIQKFQESVKCFPSHCLCITTYLHEAIVTDSKPDKAKFDHEDTVNSFEYISDGMIRNMIWSLVHKRRKRTIVILSSTSYALSVLGSIRDNPINTSLTFILGDLWSDQQNMSNLYSVIKYLTFQGHTIYGLRMASNGTNKFYSYYGSRCQPILRRYKASLIINTVCAIAAYVKNISEKHPKWWAVKFSKQDFNHFMTGHGLNLIRNWTGSRRASNGLHVLKWSYGIVQLKSGGTSKTLKLKLYGKWTLKKFYNREGKRRLSRGIQSQRQKALPPTTPGSSSAIMTNKNCNNKVLRPMQGLASTLALLIFVIFIVYAAMLQFDVQRLHSAMCSLSRITLAANTIASIAISFWVTIGGVAFSCEHRTADFIVNLLNSVCYSVIFLFLLSKKFDQPVIGFFVRRIGFFLLMGFQATISAFSHFVFTLKQQTNQSQISYCSGERQKPLSVASYCYSVVLLIASVLVYLFNQRQSQESRTIVLINSFTAVIVGSLYTVFVSVFLSIKDCAIHGQFLVIISLYPALVCVTMTIVFAVVYCCKLHYREVNRNEPDMERNTDGNEVQMSHTGSEPNEYVSVDVMSTAAGLQSSRTSTIEYEL
jgi:hypothetical protein